MCPSYQPISYTSTLGTSSDSQPGLHKPQIKSQGPWCDKWALLGGEGRCRLERFRAGAGTGRQLSLESVGIRRCPGVRGAAAGWGARTARHGGTAVWAAIIGQRWVASCHGSNQSEGLLLQRGVKVSKERAERAAFVLSLSELLWGQCGMGPEPTSAGHYGPEGAT